MNTAKTKAPLRGAKGFLVYMGLSVLVGVFAGVGGIIFGDWPGPLGLLLTGLVHAVAMAAALLICVFWWRGIDEAAREAHKWAWFWGGSSGMALGGVLLMTVLSRDGLSIGPLSANEVLAGGMLIMLLCQVLGYTIAWAFWWARRR
jgi:hypothetical protein